MPLYPLGVSVTPLCPVRVCCFPPQRAACAWSKAITPVLNYQSVEGLYGAGHNSLFTDYDGNTWICYHAVASPVGHDVVSSAMHRVHFGRGRSCDRTSMPTSCRTPAACATW